MQNQPSEIQSANSSEHKHQMFWDDLNNPTTTQPNESYFNKFKRLIPKHHLNLPDFMNQCSDGKAILENIAEQNHSDIIKFLFEDYVDIDIDKKYIGGNTLLHIAVKNGNSQMAEFLIKKGARIEILNDNQEIPLTLYPTKDNGIKELIEITQRLDRELNIAIKNKNTDEIKKLLDKGARPNGGITQRRGEVVNNGKVEKGKFVSNIRLAIESDSSEDIINLLMDKCVKTTSNPLEIACSSNKTNAFKNLNNYLSKDDSVLFEKNIPNLLEISILHGSVDMVRYLLDNNDIDLTHKYQDQYDNNALQIAIANKFNFKTDDEKKRAEEIINLLIDKIREKNLEDVVLQSKNQRGHNANFMLEQLKQKELSQERFEESMRLMEGVKKVERVESDSNTGCFTALCCCVNLNIVKSEVADTKIQADLVFKETESVPQPETFKEQKPIEVQAPSNINSMSKISDISTVSIDSQRVNANSVGITLTSTPAVTPSKPSQGGGMPKPMEASSTLA